MHSIQAMKTQFYSLLFLTILLTSCGPTVQETAEIEAERQEETAQQLEDDRIEQERLYHLQLLVDQADSLGLDRQFKQAIAMVDSALTLVTFERPNLHLKKANWFYELRLYKEAIEAYTLPFVTRLEMATTSLARARCYDKIGERQLAVNDLKIAVKLGNEDAIAFHDKINPELKRVAYYETLCCDGWISHSTGRGTCSHHGGVCNWNSPVYETHRKYE